MNSLAPVLLLVLVGIVVVKFLKPSLPEGYENLSAEEAHARLEEIPGVAILDVRTPTEFAEGHIAQARNIDIYSSDFTSRLSKLNTSPSYLVYCRSGNRSVSALKRMKSLGFERVWNLSGGVSAWKGSGFTLVQ
ncbi:rhodanese-like domain-containing protein [Desulfovibrio inopinatus]|uniref:rhodanese-like domain-containing protein n=1 Tax=Desulfovibrio inopinatus TaxID=102109 RepID=UPI0003FDCA95|nr:rhodanese-like domain-containing protein [Desulfovibrio inopinatus]